jgi:hypothetical protein
MSKCLSSIVVQIVQLEIVMVLIAFGVWLLALSILFFLNLRFFNRLAKGAKGEDLKAVLDKVLAADTKNTQAIIELDKEIRRLEEEGRLHVQRVGLVRFNPFKETGGNNSFSLALLDQRNTGIIITILHTRERSRVYAKTIKNGKGDIALSEEEVRAFSRAQKSI